MELTHRFTVPTGVEETWAHFEDIASVAECFPGAQVTSADGESFAGSVKVKLGPIALVYNGTGTFVEKDEAAKRFVVDAKGKDKRGNGTAGAMVTATMTEAGPTSTDVEVLTDLNITGKAAQFGRGNVMKDVSDKLLGQFVACLEQRMQSPQEAPQESAVTGAPEDAAAEAPPEEESAPTAPPGGTTPAPAAAPAPAAPARTPPPPTDDSLDLGAAVLPVLARTYWKPVAAVVAAVLVVWWWISRS
jgi:carbon monoxide dehydrogenase subunit G